MMTCQTPFGLQRELLPAQPTPGQAAHHLPRIAAQPTGRPMARSDGCDHQPAGERLPVRGAGRNPDMSLEKEIRLAEWEIAQIRERYAVFSKESLCQAIQIGTGGF